MRRYDDLRGFLALLEREGELRRVRRPVSAAFEIAAGIRRTGEFGGPALLFENVVDHDIPVVGGLFASRHRALLALGASGHQAANAAFLRGLRHPIAPVRVACGPCQEVVATGGGVDLDRLPLPLDGSGGGGAWVLAGLTVSDDLTGGRGSAWMHRHARVGPRRLAVTSHACRGLGARIARAEALRRPLDVAIASGVHPVLLYASQAEAPPGVDGLAVGGGVLGRPLETVRCRTVGLEVPADAEIVIEGRIPPGGTAGEGPTAERDPVIEVTAITHRRDPLLVAGPTGVPASDHRVLEALADESNLLDSLRRAFPEVTAVCVPDWLGARSAAVVSLRQRYRGQARHLIRTALGDPHRLKWIVVVDDDIDVFNASQVNRAMATRFQPAEDLIVIPRAAGGHPDPVWGVDATRP